MPKEMNANRFFWDSHLAGPNGGSVALDSGFDRLSLCGERTTLRTCTCCSRGNKVECPRLRSELKFFKESMGARNRGGIGLSYRPARLQSIPGLHKRLKIRALRRWILPWTKELSPIPKCRLYGSFVHGYCGQNLHIIGFDN